MTSETLAQLTERFRAYTNRYRTDGVLEPMQQLKLDHSLRVSADARALASDMDWPEEEIHLAEAVGLFHDIARFPQFRQYRSFNDGETVDHGDLGAETLETENLLDGLAAEPRELILHAVRFHNKKELPPELTAHEEKHLRLIRDADRLDIFFVCCDAIQSGRIHDHPEVAIGVDFEGPVTPEVLEQFEQREKIDYRHLRSMADRFILQLSWIHDLSYDTTKRQVRDRNVIEKFLDVIPIKDDRLLKCFETTAAFLAEA